MTSSSQSTDDAMDHSVSISIWKWRVIRFRREIDGQVSLIEHHAVIPELAEHDRVDASGTGRVGLEPRTNRAQRNVAGLVLGESEDARGDRRDRDGPYTVGQAALEQCSVAADQGGLALARGADGVEDVGDALVLKIVWCRHLYAQIRIRLAACIKHYHIDLAKLYDSWQHQAQ